jgi:uncharacterized Zn finger protein
VKTERRLTGPEEIEGTSVVYDSPPWSEEEARARVGARALERGRLYDQGGALFDLRREGPMFTARCEGAGSEVYRVRARRAGPTTIEAHCSCPVGEGGGCKHAAALLL